MRVFLSTSPKVFRDIYKYSVNICGSVSSQEHLRCSFVFITYGTMACLAERQVCISCRMEQDMQKLLLGTVPRDGVSVNRIAQEGGDIHGSVVECRSRTCSSGGVWRRHCNALFKKQVFPVLTSPHPLVAFDGQVTSICCEYSAFGAVPAAVLD